MLPSVANGLVFEGDADSGTQPHSSSLYALTTDGKNA